MFYICLAATNRCIGKSSGCPTIGFRCPPANSHQGPSQMQNHRRYQGLVKAPESCTTFSPSTSTSESSQIDRCTRTNSWSNRSGHVIGHRFWADYHHSYTRYIISYHISRIFIWWLFVALTDFAAEDIPSVDPADQGIIQIISSSERQEIALKQVSHLVWPICIIHTCLRLTHLLSIFQEQDSPDSLFSFVIDISDDEGEEASSSLALEAISVEVRSKLEDLLNLLQQNTT